MLYTPPSQFQFEYDDTTAGTASTVTIAEGVAITSAGSTNTKGSYSTIVAATDRDWYGFWLTLSSSVSSSAINSSALLDIAIGAASSEAVVLENYLAGNANIITSTSLARLSTAFIPLFIPKGVRISARVQSATASRVIRVHLWGQSGTSSPFPVFSKCDTYGANTSVSAGQALRANATANTFGSWTNVGSTTSRDYKAAMISHQAFANNIYAVSQLFLVEAGCNSNSITRVLAAMTTAETWAVAVPPQMVVQNIPSGTQMQGRASSGAASSAQDPSIVFHMFY